MLIKLRVSLMAESAISTSCVRSFDMIENGLQIFNLRVHLIHAFCQLNRYETNGPFIFNIIEYNSSASLESFLELRTSSSQQNHLMQ